jgi:hypothetical protein
MDKKIIDWLTSGPAWFKYAASRQLLDENPEPQPAVCDDAILKILRRLKDERVGIPALLNRRVSAEVAGNAHWDLFFLADIGSASDLGLNQDIEEIFSLQSPDGAFITERAMEPDYFCLSSILVSSLVKMGYRDDLRINKYLQVMLDSQRSDGGWHCAGGYGHSNRDACPMDNLNVLMLLGQYEKYRKDPGFNGGLDLLLRHWQRKDEKWRPDGFGIGRRFMSLKYPDVIYGILRVLDVLSLFPYAIERPEFESMLDFVRQKSRDGKYFAESIVESGTDFDFGQTHEPSRWLTFLVNRIEKRVLAGYSGH